MAYEVSKNVVQQPKEQQNKQNALEAMKTALSNPRASGIDILDACNRWIPMSENEHWRFTDGKIYKPLIMSREPQAKQKIFDALVKMFIQK